MAGEDRRRAGGACRQAGGKGLVVEAHAHDERRGQDRGRSNPEGFDIVINATPLGMRKDDPLPVDVNRLSAGTFVGEVVMKEEITPFVAAARERGCRYQVGTDMLFEQIPAYLEFFGFGTTTAEHLRRVARL